MDHVSHRSTAAEQPVTKFPDPVKFMAVSPNGLDVAVITGEELRLGELTASGALERMQTWEPCRLPFGISPPGSPSVRTAGSWPP